MIRQILNALFGKSATNWQEQYLAQSQDHYDLERRQRELDRGQFNGGRYRSLYQKFYN